MHSKNRIRDPLKDKDRFVTILKGWIDQFALSMTNSDTKNYIQQLLIEPYHHQIEVYLLWSLTLV